MKKILLFCLACIMTVTVCFASSCKKNPSGNGGNDYGVDLSGVTYNDATGEMYVGTKEGKTRIKVAEHLGGYGLGWLLACGKQFLLEEENANYYLVLEGDTSLTSSLTAKLESGRNLADVYFSLATSWQNWAAQSYLANLDDLFTATIPGEDVTVESKMSDAWKTYSKSICEGETHSFSFPWTENITGIVYNETMFNQYGWQVPTTVSELLTLCETIVKDTNGKVSPFVYPGANGGYFDFLGTTWWLQIAGVEGMQQYMNFADYEVYNPDKALGEAKLAALETFTSVFGPKVNAKYSLKGSNSKTAVLAQMSFANGEAAMIPNGNWMENESADVLAENEISIKMMRTPYANDAMKDANGEYKKVGYGATADFAIVPAEASNVEGGKRFLLYLCKDEYLKLITETSGAVRPFTYDVSGCNTSDFLKSCLDIWATSENWFDCSESILYAAGKAKKFLTDNPYMKIVYDEYDAETFVYKEYSAARTNWDSYLEEVGLKK